MNKTNIYRWGLVLASTGIFINVINAQPADRGLEERFHNPGLRYRMNLNTHYVPVEYGAQDSLLDSYKAAGYGGLATNANWTDGYLKDPEELDCFFRFVRAARERELEVWLYDEEWYPSGMAGGYMIGEHPEWEAEGLFCKDTTVTGGRHIKMAIPPGTPLALEALPVVDGHTRFDEGYDLLASAGTGVLEWDVPEGEWRIVSVCSGVLFDGFQAGGMDRGGKIRRYPSLLLPEVTQRFIDLTHRKYADHLGTKLGTLFFSTFTDEPSAMAVPYGDMGYGVFPWKENVTWEFKKRYGIDLDSRLVSLMADKGDEGKLLRVQYFSLIAEFVSSHYFGAIMEYCREQEFKSGGHLLLEETMLAHVPLYGDIMACYREMDIPGIDILTSMPDQTRRYLVSGRLAASAAELEGNPLVMTEMCPIYDPQIHNGREAPLPHIRGVVNRLLVSGVNKFNNYMRLTNENDDTKVAFNTYVARICEMMTGGVRDSRIGVYYPIESMWGKFLPAPTSIRFFDEIHGRGKDDQALQLDDMFIDLVITLYDNLFEFSYIDAKAITDAVVDNGRLRNGELLYDVLILPGVETIPEQAMYRLEEFCRAGGKVVFIGAVPRNSLTEFPSPAVMEAVRSLPSGSVSFDPRLNRDSLVARLDGMLEREIEFWPTRELLSSRKRIDGRTVCMVANDNSRPKDIRVTVKGDKPVRCWDPETGDVYPLAGNSIHLPPFASLILTY